MDSWGLIISLVAIVLACLLLYFIIKTAVKHALREDREDQRELEAARNRTAPPPAPELSPGERAAAARSASTRLNP